MAEFRVARLEDIDPIRDNPYVEGEWRPIRSHFGIQAFGTNAYTASPGQVVIEDHEHSDDGHEELYFVASGRARFTLGDGDEADAPAGTFVLVRPSTRRAAVAEEPGTTVLVFGAKPGAGFEVSAWEKKFTGG